MTIRFTLNGRPVEVEARPDETLVTILQRETPVRSVRESCGIGVCGACTVLLDGELASGCLLLAPLVDGRSVETADGLPADDPVVRAFTESHAYQCGFCTPGFVLAARALLADGTEPTWAELATALGGNLCRCGSYPTIADAVRRAARSALAARARE